MIKLQNLTLRCTYPLDMNIPSYPRNLHFYVSTRHEYSFVSSKPRISTYLCLTKNILLLSYRITTVVGIREWTRSFLTPMWRWRNQMHLLGGATTKAVQLAGWFFVVFWIASTNAVSVWRTCATIVLPSGDKVNNQDHRLSDDQFLLARADIARCKADKLREQQETLQRRLDCRRGWRRRRPTNCNEIASLAAYWRRLRVSWAASDDDIQDIGGLHASRSDWREMPWMSKENASTSSARRQRSWWMLLKVSLS